MYNVAFKFSRVFVAFTFLLVTISASSALELGRLSITDPDIEIYPEFDPDILHYAARCGKETMLRLELSAQPGNTQITVNGIQTSTQGAVQVAEVSDLNADSDLEIVLSDSVGSSATYVVHCLQNDVPIITTEKRSGASEQLILFSVRFTTESAQEWSYLLIVDNNGVPRFQRRIEKRVSHFRTHPSGKYPYSYAQEAGVINNFRGGTNNNSEFVVLDGNLEKVQTVRTVPPLRHTDGHDFLIRGNGNYVLMAYEPVQRDLSKFTDENDDSYSTTEGTEDSVIQEVTPGGTEVFRWNSWDHMAIEDCTQHRFPWGYAHINSLQEISGDLIASFRGCSQVLKIKGSTGEVIWRLGRSNLSGDDWKNRGGGTAPLPIRNDPYGEFCGQHAARILENGNLLLFDNGGHCVVDPETGTSTRPSGIFSRAVEYSFDMDENTDEKFVTFQRHHSLHSAFDRYARSQGHVEPMPNGNWLISWGRGTFDDPDSPLHPDESITEVNPQTKELLSIVVKNSGSDVVLPVRAYPLSPSPDQVFGIRLSEGTNQLSVSWNEVTEADGYKAQWKSGSQSFDGTRQHTIANGRTTTYTISNLVGGTEYTVRVIATRKNTLDGTPSLQVTGTPRRGSPPPRPSDPPPGQVSGVILSEEVNQLSVSWNDVTETDGYKVQWKSGSQSFDGTRQHTITNGRTTTYTISNLTGGTEYTVRVIATRKNTPDGTPSLQVTGSPLVKPEEVDTFSNPRTNSSPLPPSSLVNDGSGGCAIASGEVKRNTSQSALLNLSLLVFIPFLILWRKNLKEKQRQYFRPNQLLR